MYMKEPILYVGSDRLSIYLIPRINSLTHTYRGPQFSYEPGCRTRWLHCIVVGLKGKVKRKFSPQHFYKPEPHDTQTQ